MRHILLLLSLLPALLFAQVEERHLDSALAASGIKIIDVRTPGEWKESGLVKGSIPIMFFDERGGYNVDLFLSQLQKHVGKNEKFALICRSGSRSRVVADFLFHKQGYTDIINIQGGIQDAMGRQVPLEAYKGN